MWTPNTTDAQGKRYSYGQQPYIGHWNLARLKDALKPVIADASVLDAGSQVYADTYSETFGAMLAAKFGIRELADEDAPQQPTLAALYPAFYRAELLQQYHAEWEQWLQQYCQRLQRDHLPDAERHQRMNAVNPRFVLRNYLAQQTIDQATAGDSSMITELLDVLRHPYAEQAQYAKFAEKRPEWARHKAGCSMLSCSS